MEKCLSPFPPFSVFLLLESDEEKASKSISLRFLELELPRSWSERSAAAPLGVVATDTAVPGVADGVVR